jgi:hypothetical protein
VGTCLFAKPLLSNDSCIFAYLATVAQQRVYMLQYSYQCAAKSLTVLNLQLVLASMADGDSLCKINGLTAVTVKDVIFCD